MELETIIKYNLHIYNLIGQWVYQPAGEKCLARIIIFLSLSTTMISQVVAIFTTNWAHINILFLNLDLFFDPLELIASLRKLFG